jgi:hypothetical protein
LNEFQLDVVISSFRGLESNIDYVSRDFKNMDRALAKIELPPNNS